MEERPFEKNMEVLSTRDPGLAALIAAAGRGGDLRPCTSRTGHPVLKASGIALHSLYDPLGEAEAWLGHYRERIEGASTVAVLGFGLGYHVIELCRATEKEVVVFEPRVDILRTALELLDLTAVLSRVRLVTDEGPPPGMRGFTIVRHEPSINLSPGYFERLLGRLQVLQTFDRGLRIMVVGPIYGGSLPTARYCADALRRLGHRVDFVDNSLYRDAFLGIERITGNRTHRNQLTELFVDFASEAVIARCAEFKPDLVFALAQAPLAAASLRKLTDCRVPTAFWFVEDYRHLEYWKEIAPLYSYFFTIQRGRFFEELKAGGVKDPRYLPLAASPGVHRRLRLDPGEQRRYGSDVSFVGAGYHNRRVLFTGLLDFDFKIWGSEWDVNSPLGDRIQDSGRWVETEEAVKIFNATKVNINLHSSAYRDGIDPYGDFVNPRTFEIAACGAFQLVDYRSELPELLEPGREIVCFEDLDDLRGKIRYYLERPEEREAIASRGRERVARDHTYEQRMEEMLQFVLDRGYEPPPWSSELAGVETLIESAGEGTELGRYLSRFEGRIGLDEIVEAINSGDASLSEVEKIFLLMEEMRKVYLKG